MTPRRLICSCPIDVMWARTPLEKIPGSRSYCRPMGLSPQRSQTRHRIWRFCGARQPIAVTRISKTRPAAVARKEPAGRIDRAARPNVPALRRRSNWAPETVPRPNRGFDGAGGRWGVGRRWSEGTARNVGGAVPTRASDFSGRRHPRLDSPISQLELSMPASSARLQSADAVEKAAGC